jgi:hypothetical protein
MGNGKNAPVGLWTFWYDHSPRDQNKKMQVAYDAQGNAVPGSLKQWNENKPGCQYVLQNALPTVTNKLTCQFCMGSSRALIPVDLPTEALGLVFKIDVRDEKEGVVTFKNVVGFVAGVSGGPVTALAAAASAWSNANKPPVSSTNCQYFITSDGAAARRWYQSKGSAFPAATTVLHAPVGNPTNETRPIELHTPYRQVYVCVQNNNNQASANATVSVMALVQSCP